jgi:D-beta-D-heptose 7-phosphate kinase/D-beta-D-heptose 1-phosphate adenosyltransferase
MNRSGEKSDLNQIIKRFSEVRILVVGDIMMDRFLWGKVFRISPEAPVPVVVVEKETFLLGGAANVVNNIHSLDGQVSLCGVLGDDELGQRIMKELNEKGVENQGVFLEPGRQTTVKTRVIAHHHPYQQQLVRIDRETTDHPKHSTLRSLSGFLEKNLGDADGVVISDYGKGLLTRPLIQTIIQEAKRQKKFVMVDPKPKNFSLSGRHRGHSECEGGERGLRNTDRRPGLLEESRKNTVGQIEMRSPGRYPGGGRDDHLQASSGANGRGYGGERCL